MYCRCTSIISICSTVCIVPLYHCYINIQYCVCTAVVPLFYRYTVRCILPLYQCCIDIQYCVYCRCTSVSIYSTVCILSLYHCCIDIYSTVFVLPLYHCNIDIQYCMYTGVVPLLYRYTVLCMYCRSTIFISIHSTLYVLS